MCMWLSATFTMTSVAVVTLDGAVGHVTAA